MRQRRRRASPRALLPRSRPPRRPPRLTPRLLPSVRSHFLPFSSSCYSAYAPMLCFLAYTSFAVLVRVQMLTHLPYSHREQHRRRQQNLRLEAAHFRQDCQPHQLGHQLREGLGVPAGRYGCECECPGVHDCAGDGDDCAAEGTFRSRF